jgi:hypothetical protein
MKNNNYSKSIVANLPRAVVIGTLTATILVVPQLTQAQQWHFDPVIRVGYEYDDNARLIPNPGSNDEAQGYLIEASAAIGTATERTTFDITPLIRSRNYDEERFDSDDGFLRLDLNHQGLKSKFRIRGNYAQESVRTAERADADPDIDDPDEILGEDSGDILAFGDRNRLWLLPQWSYDFSERSAINVAIRYTDVDYDDTLPGRYTPYSDARIEASFSRSLSTRTKMYVRAGAGRFERDISSLGVPDEVDGLGIDLGIERGLTETTRLRAEVGYVETEPLGGQSDSDIVWDFNLIRTLETIKLLAQVKRSVNSDGLGRLSLRDSFNLSAKNRFSERLEGGLGIRAYSADQLSSDIATFEERDYAQLRATLSYALTRTFLIEGDYRYTYIDRSMAPDTAKSNSITIWFTWEPNRR